MRRFLGIGLIAAVMVSSSFIRASSLVAPGRCPGDSKLLNGGPTAVFGAGPGTWWGLVVDGLDAAGFTTDTAKISYLNGVFGTSYIDLNDLKTYNIQLVDQFWDANRNGYVCAFELRGTRQYLNDPFINTTAFGISDDKIGK